MRPCVLIVVVLAPMLAAWMTWNYVSIGEFRISSLTGWNRSKTVYNLFDRVRPEDRVIGEVLTASYLDRNKNGQIVRDHMWSARDGLLSRAAEMPLENPYANPSKAFVWMANVAQTRYGMQYTYTQVLKVALGDYIGHVSAKLATDNPGQYLKNVATNFISDTFSYKYTDTTAATAEGETSQSPTGGSTVKHAWAAKVVGKAIIVQLHCSPFVISLHSGSCC